MKNETNELAEQFFYEYAGYPYDPLIETAEQDRRRCAKTMAQAEANAKSLGVRYHWRQDKHMDSREFSNEKPHWPLYECSAMLDGECVGSLCGIDFGRGKKPHGAYKRVVEAEIVYDLWHESIESHDAACRDIVTA